MTELMFKATIALAAKTQNDPRYDELVQMLMERMNQTKEEVEQNIFNLAMGLV